MSDPVTMQTAQIEWRDGIPYSSLFQDLYYSGGHSREENGLRETEYIFLQQNRLAERWRALHSRDNQSQKLFTIGETGFGSGLNFLAACDLWLRTSPRDWRLHFFSAELFPLAKQDLQEVLSRWPQLQALSGQLINQYPSTVSGIHPIQFASGRINLYLMFGDAAQMYNQLGQCCDKHLANYQKKPIDAWFLDGFSPIQNPHIWSDDVFEAVASLSANDSTLATFTCASAVRKGLARVGFEVKKINGFSKKRHALVGTFKMPSAPRLSSANLWHLNKSPTAKKTANIAILGAGIAGCTTAAALAKRGYQVTVIDRHGTAGQEGSGNSQGIIYPKLSLWNDSLPRINLAALMFASRYYQPFWQQGLGAQCGVLLIPESEKTQRDFAAIARRFAGQHSLVQLVDNAALCAQSGLVMQAEMGLYFPQLGWLPPEKICQQLLDQSHIPLIRGDVHQLKHDSQNAQWQLLDKNGTPLFACESLVIANAYGCEKFSQTAFLPVSQLRGQVSQIPCSVTSASLKTVICGKGYITPEQHGLHCCGATYNKGLFSLQLRDIDHRANLHSIRTTDTGITDSIGSQPLEKWTGRANYRCTSSDYLPIVGAVPNRSELIEDYSQLRHNANANPSAMGSYLPHLFVHCALGSRGLSYAPLTAELLAAEIAGEIPPLPRELRLAMHPTRFLIRDLKKNKI